LNSTSADIMGRREYTTGCQAAVLSVYFGKTFESYKCSQCGKGIGQFVRGRQHTLLSYHKGRQAAIVFSPPTSPLRSVMRTCDRHVVRVQLGKQELLLDTYGPPHVAHARYLRSPPVTRTAANRRRAISGRFHSTRRSTPLPTIRFCSFVRSKGQCDRRQEPL
jgi:hypothetical protein